MYEADLWSVKRDAHRKEYRLKKVLPLSVFVLRQVSYVLEGFRSVGGEESSALLEPSHFSLMDVSTRRLNSRTYSVAFCHWSGVIGFLDSLTLPSAIPVGQLVLPRMPSSASWLRMRLTLSERDSWARSVRTRFFGRILPIITLYFQATRNRKKLDIPPYNATSRLGRKNSGVIGP